MPRTRKPKEIKTPDDTNLNATGGDAPEAQEGDAGGENRPSQLSQIRAALADAPVRQEPADEAPETGEAAPQPEEEPELPAHVDEPAAAAAEPEAEAAAPPAEEHSALDVTPPPTSAWVPPPAYPPPAPAPAQAARSAGSSSGLALGLVLVVVGIFFLIMRLFNIDLSSYGWPLYVIIPGLTLLIVGFVSLGTGALVPGGIVTVTGLILAAQNATGDWASWAYAWTLVVPGGAGLGLFLQGLRVHDAKQLRLGRNMMFWAALMFMIGFVIFESIFNISGQDFGIVSRAALPVLLIIIGVTLLARSVQRGRSA
jgi:hypothetical protein